VCKWSNRERNVRQTLHPSVTSTPKNVGRFGEDDAHHTGWNVTTDNSFTSYQLSKELTKRKLMLVGTIRGNHKEIPLDMLPAADREVKSSVFGFSADGATMVSYVPKRRKAVVLLSTQHRDDDVMPDDSRKPEIIQYYNTTKCGVDVLDKLVCTYSCKRATRRIADGQSHSFSTCWTLRRTTRWCCGLRRIRANSAGSLTCDAQHKYRHCNNKNCSPSRITDNSMARTKHTDRKLGGVGRRTFTALHNLKRHLARVHWLTVFDNKTNQHE